MKSQTRRAGIVGVPPLAVIKKLNEEGVEIFDLDTPLVKADLESTVAYIPRVYCAILRTVVMNALHLDLDAIYIDAGPGKCDCALHVSQILQDILAIPVIKTINSDDLDFGNAVCRSGLALTDKFLKITENVKSARALDRSLPACEPVAGFWGVPPRDFSILSLFPAATHIYGWTRCMENKTPANHSLELHCNSLIPTVFFAQSFCAKTALAKHLAANHPRALYLDADVTAGGSTKAKVQAFLELSEVRT